jgi:hypothetical protein
VVIGNGTKQWGLLLRYKTMVLKNSKEHIIYNLGSQRIKAPFLTYDHCSEKRTSEIISQTRATACFLQFSISSKFLGN